MVVIESIWLVFQNKIFSFEHREHDETIHVLPLLNNPFPVSKSCKDDSIRISLSTIELLINCCTFVIILGTGVTFVRRRSPLSADQPRQVSRWAARPRDIKVMIYNQSAELELRFIDASNHFLSFAQGGGATIREGYLAWPQQEIQSFLGIGRVPKWKILLR